MDFSQAITRVNRLDTDDKEFGYIIDYKDLFKKVENVVAILYFTTGLLQSSIKFEQTSVAKAYNFPQD